MSYPHLLIDSVRGITTDIGNRADHTIDEKTARILPDQGATHLRHEVITRQIHCRLAELTQRARVARVSDSFPLPRIDQWALCCCDQRHAHLPALAIGDGRRTENIVAAARVRFSIPLLYPRPTRYVLAPGFSAFMQFDRLAHDLLGSHRASRIACGPFGDRPEHADASIHLDGFLYAAACGLAG